MTPAAPLFVVSSTTFFSPGLFQTGKLGSVSTALSPSRPDLPTTRVPHFTLNKTNIPPPLSIPYYSLHLSNIIVITNPSKSIPLLQTILTYSLYTRKSTPNFDVHPFQLYDKNNLQHVEVGWSIGRMT